MSASEIGDSDNTMVTVGVRWVSFQPGCRSYSCMKYQKLQSKNVHVRRKWQLGPWPQAVPLPEAELNSERTTTKRVTNPKREGQEVSHD
jgi:hypothetical protein